MKTAQSLLRSEPPSWLPGLVPQSMLRDVFTVRLPSLARRVRQATKDRALRGSEAIAAEWQAFLGRGMVGNRAELARRGGVSRARVSQVLGPLSAITG